MLNWWWLRSKKPDTRVRAVERVAKKGRRGAKRLLPMLLDPAPEVVSAALMGLRGIATQWENISEAVAFAPVAREGKRLMRSVLPVLLLPPWDPVVAAMSALDFFEADWRSSAEFEEYLPQIAACFDKDGYKNRACALAGYLKHPELVRLLVDRLVDHDAWSWEDKERNVEWLRPVAEWSAPLLLEAVRNSEGDSHIRWVLRKSNIPLTLEQLLPLYLVEDPEIHVYALNRLQEHHPNWPNAVATQEMASQFINALEHAPVGAAAGAALALKFIAHPDCIPALVSALSRPHRLLRERVGDALREKGWTASTPTEMAYMALAKCDWGALRECGPVAAEVLQLACQDRSWHEQSERIPAIRLLAQFRPDLALPLLKQALSLGVTSDREAAIDGLAEIGGEESARELVPLLALDKEWFRIRAKAAEALGRIGVTSSIDALVPLIQDDDSNVRCSAGNALAALGWQPQDGQQSLALELARQQWAEVLALGPAGQSALIQLLNGYYFQGWYSALEALADSGDAQCASDLVRLFENVRGDHLEVSNRIHHFTGFVERVGNQLDEGLLRQIAEKRKWYASWTDYCHELEHDVTDWSDYEFTGPSDAAVRILAERGKE